MPKTIRHFSLILNFLILLLPFLVLAGETVTVNQVVPSQVESGKEFNIEVEISKGAIAGFAKYQIELPDGISVKEGDSKGASFTFADQKVKFIWMSLPADASFKINFKATAILAGTFTIPGTFSYVENNETQKAKANASALTVGASGGSTAVAITEPVKKEEPVIAEKPKEEAASKTETPTTPKAEEKAVAVETPQAPKAEEKAPVIEEVKAPVSETKPEAKSETAPTSSQGTGAAAVVPTPASTQVIEEPKVEPMVVSVINSKGSSKGVSATPSAVKTEPKAVADNTKPSSSGIVFRVQLGATHSEADKDSLQQKTAASQIFTENSNGWFKFSAGSFASYSEARDYRNEMKTKGIAGAFIIAIKNGTVMNLQDALKEAHQKWVP